MKKYDKRTGGLLCLPFTQLALREPFFTTEPLTRLVRDCEANLEVLFPLEAEVVEPNNSVRYHEDSPADTANVSAQPTSTLGEETGDVYRMTISAMRTIQGLKRESSTYNPLSFSSIFGCQDNDSPGVLTAENSGSDSLDSSPKDTQQDDDPSTR